MRYNFVLPEDYDETNRKLHQRVKDGETLSKEESYYFCHCIRFENLLLHPFCLDQYFTRVFIGRNESIPKELLQLYPLRQKDHIYYIGLVNEWERTINKTNHSDQLLQIAATETREELRNLRKRFSIFLRTFSSRDYQVKKFKLLEWSKYRYIIIKEVFELSIKSDHYKLYLNGQEIIFNYYSLVHILTRHFGHVMKPYETDKSHFTKDIHHEEVHLRLEQIFKQIDNSNIYKDNSMEEVNIRLNGTLYKIFTDYEQNGSAKFLRLNSFFPIENKQMLERLSKQFEEKIIDVNLSVFVKIGS